MNKFLINFFLILSSLFLLVMIYASLIIPYKIFTNSPRFYATNPYAMFSKDYGYMPNKNLNSIIELRYIDRSYQVFTDNNGARISKYNSNHNEEAEHEILIIGDSLSFGYGLNYKDVFSNKLEFQLSSKIRNLAVPGYGTVQSLKILENNIESEKIIIYGFIEDHLRRNVTKCAPSDGIYCIHIPVAKLDRDKKISITDEIKINNFDLNQVYQERLTARDYFQLKDFFYGFKYMKHSLYKRLGFYQDKYSQDEKLYILKILLEKMLQITNLIFVNLDLNPSSKKIFNKISKMNFNKGIYFLDASPNLNEGIDLSKLIIQFDGHPNEKGNDYFAKKIFDFIKKHNLK